MQDATKMATFVGLLLCLLIAAPAWSAAPQPLEHVVQPGDNLIKICGEYRDRTNHYSLTDLLTDIRRANGLESNFLKIGQRLTIPVLAADPGATVHERVADGAELRGIYLTGPACGVSSVLRRVDAFIDAGGNAVVFDAKDIDGAVSYLSRSPLASWGVGRSGPVISSLGDMIDRFDRRGLYVTARIALFLDGELGRNRPDLALQDEQGEPWTERGCVWVDPAADEVVAYNLALAEELARAGVDEIQFDYMRFPTNGWVGDHAGDEAATAERRRLVIAAFLTRARDVLAGYDVRISADLYGIMAWGRVEDLALTGQHVPTIAALVDVICPMIYPSHFGAGFEGRRRPGDDPGYFVGEGTRRFGELVAGQAEIRPWLQAFPYGVSRYDEQYVRIQIETARESGGAGWCLWNPACRYAVALGAVERPADVPVEGVHGSVLAALATEPADEPAAEPDHPQQRRSEVEGAPAPVMPARARMSFLSPLAPSRPDGAQKPHPER